MKQGRGAQEQNVQGCVDLRVGLDFLKMGNAYSGLSVTTVGKPRGKGGAANNSALGPRQTHSSSLVNSLTGSSGSIPVTASRLAIGGGRARVHMYCVH